MSALDGVFERAADAADVARRVLDSEEGRRWRGRVATVLIVGAPFISELPVIRRSPIARIVRTAAVGTLIVKGAEWLRDWEPRRFEGLAQSPNA
jgi:hypothetical protein